MTTQLSLMPSVVSPYRYLENKKQTDSSQAKKDFSNKYHKRNYKFIIYPNSVFFEPPGGVSSKRLYRQKTRGKIKKFSKRARFRLFQILSTLKTDLDRKPLFVTLTYHYGFTVSDNKFQEDFHSFLTSLRNYDSQVQYIWKLELQKRGAPHFHMIIFPGGIYDYDHNHGYYRHLSQIWHRISDPNSKAHALYGCKIVTINDYRHACAYVSKYCAKNSDNDNDQYIGKRYGCSRNLPVSKPKVIITDEVSAHFLLESIRKWLVSKGKNHYQSNEYFNVSFSQFIFIEENEFMTKLLHIKNLFKGEFEYG